MWSTLIIMEVIPFLVLAVGVDNMFVLAHSLHKQHPALPLPTRMGLALAAVGPSITLAATCEVAAFGLGALTSMPAVRNFSMCAAVAVLLDFVLQVGRCNGQARGPPIWAAGRCCRAPPRARCLWPARQPPPVAASAAACAPPGAAAQGAACCWRRAGRKPTMQMPTAMRRCTPAWLHPRPPVPAPPPPQMTVFVALLAYDTVRMEQYGVDCAPCVLLPPAGEELLLPGNQGQLSAGAAGLAGEDQGSGSMWGDEPSNPARVEGVLRRRSLQHLLQVGRRGREGGREGGRGRRGSAQLPPCRGLAEQPGPAGAKAR
jgi:hypothetical protein